MRSLGTRTTKNRMNFTYSATCQDSSFGTDTNPGWRGLHHPLTLRPRPQSKETAHDRYQQKSTQLTQKSQDKCAISKGLLDALPAPEAALASAVTALNPSEPPVERHSAAARLQGDARAWLKTVSKASCGCSSSKTDWMIP